MIFVFGSNKAGIHGAGAARYALLNKGAKMKVGEGIQGESYALPTKGFFIEEISLLEIKESIDRFIKVAREMKETKFQVTRVGCGLGGKQDADIAPLFRDAPDNCYFDTYWRPWLDSHDRKRAYWGTF